MADHQARRGARAGDRHADLQTAIGGRAPQFLGNRAGVAEEPCQAAQIEDEFLASIEGLVWLIASMRGENSCAIASSASGALPSAAYIAPNMTGYRA